MPTLIRRALLLACVVAAPLLAMHPAAAAPVLGDIPRGNPDAPVTVIEYASLTCPHCAAFARETMPELQRRYIDTGKVKYVYRDFPLDQTALRASQLARCSGPERFYQYLDVMFAQQRSWANAADPIAALKQLVRLGGLGGAEADACLADEDLANSILQSRLQAQQEHKVDSTPSFLVNGQMFTGERSIDGFAALLDPLVR